jgi:hypothetical protein
VRSKALTTNNRAWRTSWESIIGRTSHLTPALRYLPHHHLLPPRSVCQLRRSIASKRVYPLRFISSLQCGKPFCCSLHVTDAGTFCPSFFLTGSIQKYYLRYLLRLVLHILSSANNYPRQREGIYGRINVGGTVEFLRRNYNQMADPRHITIDPIAPGPISRRFGERGDCVRERQILRQCRGVRRIR